MGFPTCHKLRRYAHDNIDRIDPTARGLHFRQRVGRKRIVRSWVTFAVISFAATALVGSGAEARITRIYVVNSELAFDGATFGEVGQYEHLGVRVKGELDPADPANAIIQDINLAPRNERGMVEYQTNVELLKPTDMGAAIGSYCSRSTIAATSSR
jgi:hypothetical protein